MTSPAEHTWLRAEGGALRCAFEYPADWRVREISNGPWPAISLIGPTSRDIPYIASITLYRHAARGGRPDAVLENAMERHRVLNDFHELGRHTEDVAGESAVGVDVVYQLRLPPRSLDARPTAVRERRLVLSHAGDVYEIVYSASEQEYEALLPVLQGILRTLSFGHRGIS